MILRTLRGYEHGAKAQQIRTFRSLLADYLRPCQWLVKWKQYCPSVIDVEYCRKSVHKHSDLKYWNTFPVPSLRMPLLKSIDCTAVDRRMRDMRAL
jgi:hypothetical protein